MTTDLKLTIEMIPNGMWGTNVRSQVPKAHWDIIRKECYKRSGYRCDICSEGGKLDAHEIWDYSLTAPRIQKLTGLTSLCTDCHRVKHAGLAVERRELHLVLQQLCKINGMTEDEAAEYVDYSFALWRVRSSVRWTNDISFIDTYLKPFEKQDLRRTG